MHLMVSLDESVENKADFWSNDQHQRVREAFKAFLRGNEQDEGVEPLCIVFEPAGINSLDDWDSCSQEKCVALSMRYRGVEMLIAIFESKTAPSSVKILDVSFYPV